MKKTLIRLTENDLHALIEESVKQVMKEYEDPWYRENRPKGFFGGMKSSYEGDDKSEEMENMDIMCDDSTGLDRLANHARMFSTTAGRTLGKIGRYLHKPSNGGYNKSGYGSYRQNY